MMTVFQETSLRPLHALFSTACADDAPVCHDGQRFVGWQAFATRVAGLAAAVRGSPQTRWLLTSGDPLEFAAELFAALGAGRVAVIPPNVQPGTLAALGDAFDARFDALGPIPSSNEAVPACDPATARIDLYTSGSTGEHKRVVKTLAQLEAEVAVLELLWGPRLGTATIVATAPHQHIYGLLFRLLWPLAAGRVFDAVTCAHPDTLAERLALFGRAALVSSPAQLARLPELLPLAELSPRPVVVFSSGGPLPADTAQAFFAGLGEAPLEIFGSTETGGVAWRQQHGAAGDRWTPLPGHTVGCSAEGALVLRSAFVSGDAPWEMDDGIALQPDGRFRLLGRLDRVVKIEEKRLALPDMEARLLAHPWLTAAAVLPLGGRRQRVGAVAVLGAAGLAALRAKGRRELVRALREHLGAYFDAVLLPRHWRFPARLPVDARGKLPVSALAAMFSGPTILPEVLGVTEDGAGKARLDLFVTPDIAHFAGHFPGAPILPGVTQVDWAVHFARRYLPVSGAFTALENLKFLAAILPGVSMALTLVWDERYQRVDFSYAGDRRAYSSGRIVFGGAA